MLIRARSVTYGYARQPVLFADLSFELGAGDLVAVTGPSGSGKSTLLGLVAGILDPVEGTVERYGIATSTWVLQNPHGVPRRTALDHVTLPLLAKGETRRSAEANAVHLLERFQILALGPKPYRSLSGGEAQRLMLARAVAASPDLLLVDEPTAQLDPTSAGTVIGVLDQLAQEGTIVLVATHDTAVVDRCDRIIGLTQAV